MASSLPRRRPPRARPKHLADNVRAHPLEWGRGARWAGAATGLGFAAMVMLASDTTHAGIAAQQQQTRTAPPPVAAIQRPTAAWPGIGGLVPVRAALPAPGPTEALTADKPAPTAYGLAGDGIPITALKAYRQAAQREAGLAPACHITWPLLAAIGRVESDHGRFAGAMLHTDGLSTPPVIGIPLNGEGTALITDTDGGTIDGDAVFDRAVGPMQFIPGTWAGYGVDANKDGRADPFNIFDAAAAAADYLCAAGGDLATSAGQTRAVLAYNHDATYLTNVLALERAYASGSAEPIFVPPPAPAGSVSIPDLPAVNPGAPAALSTTKTSSARTGTTAGGTTSAASSAASSTSQTTSSAPSTSAAPTTTAPSNPPITSDAPTATSQPTSSAPSSDAPSSTASTAPDTTTAGTTAAPAGTATGSGGG